MLATIVFSSTQNVSPVAHCLAILLQALLCLSLGAAIGAAIIWAVLAIPATFWLGIALIALFGLATWPRKAVTL